MNNSDRFTLCHKLSSLAMQSSCKGSLTYADYFAYYMRLKSVVLYSNARKAGLLNTTVNQAKEKQELFSCGDTVLNVGLILFMIVFFLSCFASIVNDTQDYLIVSMLLAPLLFIAGTFLTIIIDLIVNTSRKYKTLKTVHWTA